MGGHFSIEPRQVAVFPDGTERPLASRPAVRYHLDGTVQKRSKSALKPRARSHGPEPHREGSATIRLEFAYDQARSILESVQGIIKKYCYAVPGLVSLNENRTEANWHLLHNLGHPVQWNALEGVAWPRGMPEFDKYFMAEEIFRSTCEMFRNLVETCRSVVQC